jgi:hypothetical protein
MKKKILAFLLIVSLFVTSCTSPVDNGPAPRPRPGDTEQPAENITEAPQRPSAPATHGRRTVHFDDMVYERVDAEAIIETVGQLTEQLSAAADFEAAMQLELQLAALMEHFSTQYALAYIRKDLDMTDDYYENEFRFLSDVQVDVSLAVSEFNRELVEGRFAAEYLEHVGEFYFDGVVRSLLYECESVTDYKKELASLYVDYEAMIFSLTVEHDGDEFNYNDTLFAVWRGMDFLMESYYEQYLEQYVRIYARIIELYKLIAFELGFDCAAEMLYNLRFNREYTPADAMVMFDDVKNYLVPLTPLLWENSDSPPVNKLKALMEDIPGALAKVDAELAEVWDFMVAYGVFDFDDLPEKAVTGYMINLPAYDTPFIYTYWDYDYFGAYTILHEFGHFYDGWLRYSPDYDGYILLNLDSSEFYADGMALILQEHYSALTDEPALAQRFMVYNTVFGSIIVQSMFEEFQLRAFELEEVNADTLGLLYTKLFLEYGFDSDIAGRALTADVPYNDWIRISHFFYLPFYTVSYVTSSVALMQLWEVAERDNAAAARIYLDMIRGDQNMSFSDLLESVSLRPPHIPGVLRSIAEQVVKYFSE